MQNSNPFEMCPKVVKLKQRTATKKLLHYFSRGTVTRERTIFLWLVASNKSNCSNTGI